MEISIEEEDQIERAEERKPADKVQLADALAEQILLELLEKETSLVQKMVKRS